MLKVSLALIIFIPIIIFGYSLTNRNNYQSPSGTDKIQNEEPSPSLKPETEIPNSYIIPQKHHAFQTFNNCGPAALSMALSYYGINKGQQELGQKLRPYQNPQGDNDDKSVTLEEIAKEAQNYDLIAFHRPNGDIVKLKKLIASGIPVLTRTLLVINDDIGHYRLIRGYDDNSNQLIQDDSLQSANSRYTYSDFLALWKPYNFEYLILVPKEKEEIVRHILGEETDTQMAWQNSYQRLKQELAKNPNDVFAQFNLSNTLYQLGRYQEAIVAYEKVESSLSFRTLWYQIEPILAYKAVNNYQKVFEITNRVIQNDNRAFSELYIIRGDIYIEQGDKDSARQEYENAVFYNENLDKAQIKLATLK